MPLEATPRRAFMWRVLEREAGLADVAGDRGGLTNRGVTRRLYRSYCIRLGATPSREQFAAMTDALAAAIYEAEFIVPLRLIELDAEAVREAVFGAAIHHGGRRAIRMAQAACGGLKRDGLIGPKTIDALNAAPPVAFANSMALRRIKLVGRLVARTAARGDLSQVQFLVGWLNRFTALIRPAITHP